MITIEELCADNHKLVDENLKLRKENAELKKKLKEKLKTIADKDLSFVAKFDALEFENAELKERLKEHESVGNAQFWKNVWSWKSRAEQLAKAKDILFDLVTDYRDKSIKPLALFEEIERAKKFLEE